MGLNVGGIHVRTRDAQRVVDVIKAFWFAVGARPLRDPPLTLEPLSVQKTGKLGYVVSDARPDASGEHWVAVYDSERYHGSAELAQALANELDTLVLYYSLTSTVDEGMLRAFRGAGAGADAIEDSGDWGDVETTIGALPWAFLYYNKLPDEAGQAFEKLTVFGFEALPFRDSGYRGPSVDERAAAAVLEDVERAAKSGDVATVRAIYDARPAQHHAIIGTICSAVERGWDPTIDPSAEELACYRVLIAMADVILAEPSAYGRVEKLATGAYLAHDRDVFEAACKALGPRVASLGSLVSPLIMARRFDEALELLRRVIAVPKPAVGALNHLAYTLILVPTLPSDAAELLQLCDAHGPAYSYIFHNTACAWLRLGDQKRALAAIRAAVKADYPDIEKMRVDPDLAALHAHPEFKAAFAKR